MNAKIEKELQELRDDPALLKKDYSDCTRLLIAILYQNWCDLYGVGKLDFARSARSAKDYVKKRRSQLKRDAEYYFFEHEGEEWSSLNYLCDLINWPIENVRRYIRNNAPNSVIRRSVGLILNSSYCHIGIGSEVDSCQIF
jgi:hypothetical protein